MTALSTRLAIISLNALFSSACVSAIEPRSQAFPLTPRPWKQHFAHNSLHSELNQFHG